MTVDSGLAEVISDAMPAETTAYQKVDDKRWCDVRVRVRRATAHGC